MIEPDTEQAKPWDPLGTLASALWLCGGQWAGKTTVARMLADRYGLVAYHYDYHDARTHTDRLIARRARAEQDRRQNAESVTAPDTGPEAAPEMEARWVDREPEQMAAEVLAGFPTRFEFALDDLRALYAPRPIIADGWGLRPELVRPLLDSPRQMLVMVPTDAFREQQARTLTRASFAGRVSDPERAQRNRIARDRLIAEDAVRTAERLGIRVLWTDGSLAADAMADLVADHWAPYLPDERTASHPARHAQPR